MNKLQDFIAKVPRDFWINNGLLGLIFFFVFPDSILRMLLFPFAVLMLRHISLKYLVNIPVDYFGFYPFRKDFKWLVISFLVGIVIYQTVFPIIMLGGLYILWLEGYLGQYKKYN